jgi:hypothetical protein
MPQPFRLWPLCVTFLGLFLAGCAVHPPPRCCVPPPATSVAAQAAAAGPLQERARGFQRLIDEHLQPQWPLGCLVTVIFADPSMASVTGFDDPQDSAIWTGIYTAAQAFRYASTPADSPAAKQAALDGVRGAVGALHALAVTPGYPGGLARVVTANLERDTQRQALYRRMFEKELYRYVAGTQNVFFDFIALAAGAATPPGTADGDREALRRFPGPPSVWSCVQPPASPLDRTSLFLRRPQPAAAAGPQETGGLPQRSGALPARPALPPGLPLAADALRRRLLLLLHRHRRKLRQSRQLVPANQLVGELPPVPAVPGPPVPDRFHGLPRRRLPRRLLDGPPPRVPGGGRLRLDGMREAPVERSRRAFPPTTRGVCAMRLASVIPALVALALSPILGAGPLTAQGEAPRPVLLRVHIPNGNLTGPFFATDVVVLQSGAVATYQSCGPVARPALLRSTVGIIRPPLFVELQQALTATNRVGVQSGSCSTSPPGGPRRYDVTWFGRNGRTSSFSLGAFPTGCPAEQTAIVQALLNALAAQDAVPAPVGFGDLPGRLRRCLSPTAARAAAHTPRG